MLMKTVVAATMATALSVGGIASAQQTAEPEYFVAVPDTDDGVQAAATFAVERRSEQTGEILSLVNVIEAHESAEAGIHYRLSVSALDNGQTRRAYAEVTQDADGTMHLSEWVWETQERG